MRYKFTLETLEIGFIETLLALCHLVDHVLCMLFCLLDFLHHPGIVLHHLFSSWCTFPQNSLPLLRVQLPQGVHSVLVESRSHHFHVLRRLSLAGVLAATGTDDEDEQTKEDQNCHQRPYKQVDVASAESFIGPKDSE